MSVIDEYLQNVSEPQKAALERVRKIIKQTAPDAEEVITYGMPGFKYRGKYLIAFAPFKNHMSVFPGGEAVGIIKDELHGYKTATGTVQFTLDNPLPEELIKDLVKIRLSAISKN